MDREVVWSVLATTDLKSIDRRVGSHTIRTRLQRPQRQQAGKSVASPRVRADLLQDLIPRNTLRS